MAGLDKRVLDRICTDKVLDHIKTDVRTDFIVAPHLNAIFVNAGDELWQRSAELLSAGDYEPRLPYTISVPKGRGFTRPGSILSPVDRFVYQAIVDLVSPVLEEQLDRTRVFSHVFSQNMRKTPQSSHECWQHFQSAIRNLCNAGGHIVKADIANYFERIPQHHLINLMEEADCLPEAVNLLEKMLSAFQGRNSFGIVQGVLPSDLLGDFYMSDLDAHFAREQIPSARYNDDFYLQYGSLWDSQRGLVKLIERLRKNGLHLNEFKSGIRAVQDVIREETELDDLFDAARNEIHEELEHQIDDYGFAVEWELEEEESNMGIHLAAVERLYGVIDDFPEQADKIDKFCLPILRSASSDIAIDGVLRRLPQNSHLSRIYHAYLSRFVTSGQELTKELEEILHGDDVVTDYGKMYLLASLLKANSIQKVTVDRALQWLTSTTQIAKETRAVASVFAAKHGNAVQKRAVLLAYEDEPSGYVRSAILYASRYMKTAQRNKCKRAWRGHSMLNTLTALAM